MKNSPCIVIHDIDKSFGAHQVLDHIDLTIRTGEIFGLLGPSGAGKTTMIKIITGQLRAENGSVTVKGTDTRYFDKEMYTHFGMALDNTGLYERLSSYDNLAVFADIYGIEKGRIKQQLQRVGLDGVARTPAGRLSKGQRQRLILARAFLHDPDILFLDEPTTGLDPSTAVEVRRLIRQECDLGKTVFMTTHNMAEASELCTHVALLNNGHIVEYGAPDEICRKYNHINQIHILLTSGRQVSFPNAPESAEKVASLLREGSVRSIHSTEPTLETVFMELTGRGFDEE